MKDLGEGTALHMGGGSLDWEMMFNTGRESAVALVSVLVAVYALAFLYFFPVRLREFPAGGSHLHECLRQPCLGAFTFIAFKSLSSHKIQLYEHSQSGGQREGRVEILWVEFLQRCVVNATVLVER